MTNDKHTSVFVNRMSWGQKYLFASISIPAEWIAAGVVTHPAELGQLLLQWREAYEREKLIRY